MNVAEGRQLPVRLLDGEARTEASSTAAYAGASHQLAVTAPATVGPGATVCGAGSFVVPAADTDVLAVLVVEPRRHTCISSRTSRTC